jgi:hypothetical protein
MDKTDDYRTLWWQCYFFLYAKTSKCNILGQFYKESTNSAGGEIGLGGWVVELLHCDVAVGVAHKKSFTSEAVGLNAALSLVMLPAAR